MTALVTKEDIGRTCHLDTENKCFIITAGDGGIEGVARCQMSGARQNTPTSVKGRGSAFP